MGGSAVSTHLSVFAKYWEPGKVKTRLAASIGDSEAAEVAEAFLLTTLRRHLGVAQGCRIAYSPNDARQDFELLAPDWKLRSQTNGNLGDRMAHEFQQCTEQPVNRVVLVGADSPDLPLGIVTEAFDRLQQFRLVLCPSSDGGYCLIGARGGVPPILQDMPWSSEGLWQATMNRLAEHDWREGREYAVLPEWYDVDSAEDLVQLRENLATTDEQALISLRERLDGILGAHSI